MAACTVCYTSESASHLLGHALYMFDYNVRQTSILGLVGAGGIGFYIITYIKYFDYGSAMVFMAVVLGTVLAIDWISVRVRDAYIVKPDSTCSHKSKYASLPNIIIKHVQCMTFDVMQIREV